MNATSRKVLSLMTLLALLVSSCGLSQPAQAPPTATPPAAAPALPTAVAVVRQEVSTENVEAYARGLASADRETADLLAQLTTGGYTKYVQRGDFEYANGGGLRAVSLSNGTAGVVLAQLKNGRGASDAMIFEFPDKRTMVIRDQTGRVEITATEKGEIRYSVKGAISGVGSAPGDQPATRAKLASLPAQAGGNCSTSQWSEFQACLPPPSLVDDAVCAVALVGAGITCTAPPWLDCVPLLGGALVYCLGEFTQCLQEAIDDLPTFEVAKPTVVESYSSCRDDDLVVDTLLQAQVDCKDDRQPAPSDLTLRFTAGEAKEFTCTDCAGQTCSGTVPSPVGESVVKCEYGCQVVGNGQDRCLLKGESSQPAPAPQPAAPAGTPAGTYKGTTNLAQIIAIRDGIWTGAETENTITLDVAPDGAVTGGMKYSYTQKKPVSHTDPRTRQKYDCTLVQRSDWEATASGKLTGPSGQIALKVHAVNTQFFEGCPATDRISLPGDSDIRMEVAVAGDTMEGTGGLVGFAFTARRQ